MIDIQDLANRYETSLEKAGDDKSGYFGLTQQAANDKLAKYGPN